MSHLQHTDAVPTVLCLHVSSVGLTETPELGFLLQRMLGLYVKMLIK